MKKYILGILALVGVLLASTQAQAATTKKPHKTAVSVAKTAKPKSTKAVAPAVKSKKTRAANTVPKVGKTKKETMPPPAKPKNRSSIASAASTASMASAKKPQKSAVKKAAGKSGAAKSKKAAAPRQKKKAAPKVKKSVKPKRTAPVPANAVPFSITPDPAITAPGSGYNLNQSPDNGASLVIPLFQGQPGLENSLQTLSSQILPTDQASALSLASTPMAGVADSGTQTESTPQNLCGTE